MFPTPFASTRQHSCFTPQIRIPPTPKVGGARNDNSMRFWHLLKHTYTHSFHHPSWGNNRQARKQPKQKWYKKTEFFSQWAFIWARPPQNTENPIFQLEVGENRFGILSILKASDFQKHRFWQPSKTTSQGCENGVFGKRCFCPLPKTGGFDEKWRKWRFTFYPQKQEVALLRARKPTKMTRMAGAPQTKPGFAKNRVFATLNLTIIWEKASENCRNPALSRDNGNTSAWRPRQQMGRKYPHQQARSCTLKWQK